MYVFNCATEKLDLHTCTSRMGRLVVGELTEALSNYFCFIFMCKTTALATELADNTAKRIL